MKRVYYAANITLSLLGLWALWLRLDQGLRVTALTSYISWGLWVSVYIYFIGLSAGSFLLSTMIYVFGMHQLERVGRMALLTALFSLSAGLLFIWLDLGHLERFWEIFSRPSFTSMMTIESWLYLIYMVLIVAELWLLMRADLAALAACSTDWRRSLYRLLTLGFRPSADPDRQRQQEARTRRWLVALGILGIPTAIGVHGGTGAIFAVAIARPYWNGGLFPIIFLVSALASGAALVTFLYGAVGPRSGEFSQVLRGLARLTVLFIGIDLLLLLSEVLTGLYGGVPSHVEVFSAIFRGPYPYVFWLGQVGLAGVLPMEIVAIALSRKPEVRETAAVRAGRAVGDLLSWAMAIAAVLVLAGDLLLAAEPGATTVLALREPGAPVLSAIGFWIAQVVLVACVVGIIAQRWGSPRFWFAAAGLSTVAGIFAVRLNIVIPGFAVPVLEHLESAFQDARLTYNYFPSSIEWVSTVGLIALIVLLFSLAYEILPIYGVTEEAR